MGSFDRGLLQTVQERSVTWRLSLRGTWREGFFTGNFDSCVRHVKEGFGNGASLSLWRFREGRMEGGLL